MSSDIRVRRTPFEARIEGWEHSPRLVDGFWCGLVALYLTVMVWRLLLIEHLPLGLLPWEIICAAAGLVAVALRRRHPEAAVGLVIVAALAEAVLTGAFLVMVPAVMVQYSIVRAGRLPAAVVATVLLQAAVLAGSWLAAPGGRVSGGYFSTAFMLLAGASAGLLIRWRYDRLTARDHDLRADASQRQAQARISIATDLHDTVGHALTAVISLSRGALATFDDDPAAAREALVMLQEAAQVGLDRTRGVVAQLNSDTPVSNDGDDTVAGLVARVRAAGRRVRVVAGPAPEVAHPLVGPVVREALTNALRYADDSQILVAVTPAAAGGAEVRVASGLPPTAAPPSGGGRGLAGIARRIAEAGGEFYAGPAGDQWVLAPRITRELLARSVLNQQPQPRLDERQAAARALLRRLSERELEVLVAVGRGLTNAEIAETQHLAPSSVKTYISRLLTKLGRRDRVGLVILARDADLR